MPRAKRKTIGDIVAAVKDLQQRAAVHRAMVSILRSRYLPRDGVQEPPSAISCEGAPVPHGLIEEIVYELEEGADEMEKASVTFLAEEVN